jgi:hypothetical protein
MSSAENPLNALVCSNIVVPSWDADLRRWADLVPQKDATPGAISSGRAASARRRSVAGRAAVVKQHQDGGRDRRGDIAVGDQPGHQVQRDPFDAFGFKVGDRITAMDGLPGPVLPTRIRAPTWRIAVTMIRAALPSWGIGGITRRSRDDFVAGPTSERQRGVLGQ